MTVLRGGGCGGVYSGLARLATDRRTLASTAAAAAAAAAVLWLSAVGAPTA